MRMPEKNIGFWTQVFTWLQVNAPFLFGILLAAATAFIRERKNGTTRKQSIFEALLCAFISVGVMRALQWLFLYCGIDSSFNLLSEFCGVFIGFIGTKKIMGIIDSILAIFRDKFGVN
ncbi:phage holin, lambda family [Arsenophonus nasoniae]|uniref:Phage holin, lambda family n=1 Tax=Arsenophonus nasoniae TaxID=638 RepID=A0AA95G7Q2_9GAMM|nr:phage holin, lambda family [Arsenophonus nasoniae]WGL93786.1 phage holin, lambda family [Arsenophonus nasoniae]WGL96002.1 phage holin, lambda family [Arsenophonus nasoniae]